ncbi:hypothetical protein [Actinomyces israelii]|uniref:hypothetical protein n=1 Tax=Actinomyces israelii TaxID=1659 RepID=UPI001E2EC5EC|nr:hypothetical protein [Actinomyces israelii]
MTRPQRCTASRRRVGFSARAAFVLPAVATAALTTGAGGAAAVGADAVAPGSPSVLAAADAGGPAEGRCEEDAAQVVTGAADGAGASYGPEESVRLTGSGWCANGRLLQGERSVRVRLVAVGGYASQEEIVVPVTFVDGAFDATVQLGGLYALSGQGPGSYYLSVTVDSRQYVGTGQFQIAESASRSADQSASEPTTAPEPAGQADAADGAEPAPESAQEAMAAPGPASEPDGEPVPRSADQSASEPTTAPEPVDDVEPSPQPDPEPTPEPTPSPGPAETPASPPAPDAPGGPAAPPDPPRSEPTPAGPSGSTSQPGGGGSDGERPVPPGSQDVPGGPSGAPADPGTGPAPEPGTEPTADTGAGRGRPTTKPAAPVADASQLDASNAGSLSGTRRGNTVSLILPSDKAKKDDWVAVFLFPDESTPGWTQVDASNSVSIDVSNLEAGTYQLAVGDRDSHLLGWAQLEITTAAADTSEPARMTVGTASVPQPGVLGRDDWMLVSAGGLLLVGAASFLILASPTLTGRRR